MNLLAEITFFESNDMPLLSIIASSLRLDFRTKRATQVWGQALKKFQTIIIGELLIK